MVTRSFVSIARGRFHSVHGQSGELFSGSVNAAKTIPLLRRGEHRLFKKGDLAAKPKLKKILQLILYPAWDALPSGQGKQLGIYIKTNKCSNKTFLKDVGDD
ncbi:MAG: hypothetical protein HYV28_15485 [Ignavibacteriales bacterium]|nr:hypothetical protein [Ignavibacteriales bacterium]